jgi:serine/threonine protein kinase
MKTEPAFPVYPGWETVRLIGHGSFGTVYEIQRDVLGLTEKAALKHISIPQNQSDVEELYSTGYDETSITAHYDGYLADIVREYQMMVEMKGHTNVVNCDDIRYVQKDSGIGWDIYIKMELLNPMTKTLDRMIEEKQVVKLGKDMASALVLCRKRNILHRDIKPQNIFVSKDGDFKLGDFGIAKTVEKTSGGTKIGTYNYMAPEVFNNQPYGHEADIYSLGMVLYWLLNERRLPFYPVPPAVPMASDMERARQRRFRGEEIPAPIHGSEELKRIVLKCCAFDPKDRYHSAEDLLWELDALSAKPTGTPEKKVSSTVSTDKKSGTASRSASFLVRGGASGAGGGVLLGSLAKKKAAPEPETAGLVPPEIFSEGTTVDDLEEPAPLLPLTGKPEPEPETEGTVSAFLEKAWRHVPGKPLTRENPAHEAPIYTPTPFAKEDDEPPTVYDPSPNRKRT